MPRLIPMACQVPGCPHVPLWRLAERIHYSLWTGYTEAEAYCWLRQAVWP